MVKTINEIMEERQTVAQAIYEHLEHWQVFKQTQTKRVSNYRVGGLFNLLDTQQEDTVVKAIELYINIHGLVLKDIDGKITSYKVPIQLDTE